jgi:hypothetical protein
MVAMAPRKRRFKFPLAQSFRHFPRPSNVMFASVSSRTRYKTQLKSSAAQQNQDAENPVPVQPKTFEPKASRSLSSRRLQNITAILHTSLLRRDIKRAERAFGILLRCEKHGVTLPMLWELGLEVTLRSTGISKGKAEEFLGRVRLASSDIGRRPTPQKNVVPILACLMISWWLSSRLFLSL